MRRFNWRPAAARTLAVVLLLSLLAACRVDSITPSTTGYPGPASKPTRATAAAPRPTNPSSVRPTAVVSPAVPNVGSVAFSLTIVHTAENQGEAIPCG